MIVIEDKYIYEYISDTINSAKTSTINIKEKYHHNSEYKHAASICKHGILSLNELNNKGITNYSNEELILMNDIESHVNGNNGISLSEVGLNDIYGNEFEYDPFNSSMVDFIVSEEVKPKRRTIHYGNEYIADNRIDLKYLMSLDIRLLKLIEKSKDDPSKIKTIVENFNCLKDIATSMKESKLDIPFRERSFENISLDIEKLSNINKIKQK